MVTTWISAHLGEKQAIVKIPGKFGVMLMNNHFTESLCIRHLKWMWNAKDVTQSSAAKAVEPRR